MSQQFIHSTNQKIQQANNTDNKNQYLTYHLGDELYGIDILSIKEIIEYDDVTIVPMTPSYIRGVINLRGNVVPVADLPSLFEHTPIAITRRTCIVILEVHSDDGKYEVGMMVDSVTEVIDINPDDIDPPPSFGTRVHVSCIKGMGKTDKGFVILLDPGLFLSLDELYKLADSLERAQKKEAARADAPVSGNEGSLVDKAQEMGTGASA
ncbi:MAG: purine-binding chemotaxis protein CheW [Leptospiraceae bacterium]|nr:purine-binding chemotaxis protein CheW [Leptospiraceae bacterium]